MNIEHLVRMANDISAFFDAEAGADAPARWSRKARAAAFSGASAAPVRATG